MKYEKRFTPPLPTLLLSLLCCLCFVSTLDAQNKFQFALTGLAAFPQGEFNDTNGAVGGGGDFAFLYSPASLPFGIGLSGQYLLYGYERHREIVGTDRADFDVSVVTSNNILLSHLLLRVQNREGMLRPYLDGLIGFAYLYTGTRMYDYEWYGDSGIRKTNLDDFAFSYGGGVGLMAKVFETSLRTRVQRKLEILADLCIRYMRGGEAKYLKKGGINRVNGQLVYDALTSETDLLTAHLGVSVTF